MAPSRAQSATKRSLKAQSEQTRQESRRSYSRSAEDERGRWNLTARIRKSVMADKRLSTYAHNIKIISQNGIVTLKGPVRSDDEVRSIMAKAVEVAGGSDKVVNQMSVKP